MDNPSKYDTSQDCTRKMTIYKVTLLLLLYSISYAYSDEILDFNGDVVFVDDTSRIVSLGGAVTEIVFALGHGNKVVGVDASSSYPEAVSDIAKVSYHRRLSAEGIISLAPTLVIATTEAGPPEVIQQLRGAGISILILPHEPTVECTIEKIQIIGSALNKEKKAAEIIGQINRDLILIETKIQKHIKKQKIIFIYARGKGNLMVAGKETAANTMVELAGAVNAVQDYKGYKPLTAEAVVAAAPDVILLMDSGLLSIGGAEKIWSIPGISLTPAGKSKRYQAVNGLRFLGFGTRVTQAALELNRLLYIED